MSRALLNENGDTQAAYRYESEWVRPSGDNLCRFTHSINVNRFPAALRANSDGLTRVVVLKRAAPLALSVKAWRHVRDDGSPRGDPITLQHALLPHIEDGAQAGWRVGILLPTRFHHLYMQLEARWRDDEGCHDFAPDTGSQWVKWRFHLRRPIGSVATGGLG